MPGIAERNYSYRDNNNTNYQNPSVGNGFWSKHRDDISYNQLQKVHILYMRFSSICFLFNNVPQSYLLPGSALIRCFEFKSDLIVWMIE